LQSVIGRQHIQRRNIGQSIIVVTHNIISYERMRCIPNAGLKLVLKDAVFIIDVQKIRKSIIVGNTNIK